MPAPPRLVVLVALPLLWLTACSDSDPEPNPEPAPTATEATLEPEPSEPSIPAAAQGTDEASAKAFLRYWFEVLSEAMTTGDTASVRALSMESCKSCASVAEQIDGLYAKGGYVETRGWRARRITSDRNEEQDVADFYVDTVYKRQTLFNSQGDVVDRIARDAIPMEIRLIHQGSGWRVAKAVILR